MEVSVFQEKLKALCEYAESQNQTLTTAQVHKFFDASELDRDQLIRILQYLKTRGITIETQGGSEHQEEESVSQETVFPGNRVPLTAEEEAYLTEYLEPFEGMSLTEDERDDLFVQWQQGDAKAKDRLVMHYMPISGRMAAELNSEEILLADLIQEANLCLLGAMSAPDRSQKDDAWVLNEIQTGILRVLQEQTDQKLQDDSLVTRVEKLEEAVRELTDEEDKELKFTVDELAVILDMKVDEIRDVLRLTGDDK